MFAADNLSPSAWARRFDPRAKALAWLLGSALILLATRPAEIVLVVAALALLLVALRLAGQWLRTCRVLLPTLLLIGVVTYLAAGSGAAVAAIFRLAGLSAAGVLFFATTPPTELGDSLLASGLSPRVAFMLEGTLRFVPAMGRLLREVRDAQASRGIRLDGLHLLRGGPALLAPLLVSALRFADSLAEALEARGFGSPYRTPLHHYRFHVRDWLLVTGALALAIFGGWLLLAH